VSFIQLSLFGRPVRRGAFPAFAAGRLDRDRRSGPLPAAFPQGRDRPRIVKTPYDATTAGESQHALALLAEKYSDSCI